jgi:UDP-N-acetylmuramoyl-tripeptide--D-alanyl-D-alanine ligase
MRELGAHSDSLHSQLAPAVTQARVEQLILIGEEMRALELALRGQAEVQAVSSVEEATETLLRLLRPGDAVLVKASNSVGLARLVERVAGGQACST